jgi:hypothetical protein
MDPEVRLVSSVEAIFIFSLVWSTGINLKPAKKWIYQDNLMRSVDKYIDFRVEKTRVRDNADTYPFAMNLKKILKGNHSIFKFCYDVKNSGWIQWKSMEIENYKHPISGDPTSNYIDTLEIVRLNPSARKVF